MIKKSLVLALVASGLMAGGAVSSPAFNTKTSFSLQLRGFVPVICRATVDATNVAPQEGLVDVGTLSEFCNSPTGYQVWADYSPSLAGASVVLDGESVALSDSGSTMLSATDHAGIKSRDMALELPSDTVAGSLSIRVVAL